ncbi:MAG: hypothetical protein GXP30_12845 [Verrucomicrobia bacterium]|nr:hypothetical protein [Verrucomicrobiota bacterium]
MGKEDPALIERAKRARRIARNPAQYKVCGGCNSIVATKVNLCPNCHSYRFESDPEYVVQQAKSLSQREQQTVLSEDLL